MASQPSPYLTVRELAELLRVKERKVYSLAAQGTIPCNRATGKLLFPREEVDAWLARFGASAVQGRARRAGPAAPRPAVFAGSHDPLLDWALRESASGIASFFDGSLDGLRRYGAGEAMAAGLHLFDPSEETWNCRQVEDQVGREPAVLLEWAWRARGLIVPADNPKALKGLADLTGLRFAPRQAEAGSQVLFEALMAREGLDLQAIDLLRPPARSEADVALAVAEGKADAGIGLASLAAQFRLGFVPLLKERFDILVDRRAYFEPPFQRLLAFCGQDPFYAKAREYGGYDLSDFGRVHHLGP